MPWYMCACDTPQLHMTPPLKKTTKTSPMLQPCPRAALDEDLSHPDPYPTLPYPTVSYPKTSPLRPPLLPRPRPPAGRSPAAGGPSRPEPKPLHQCLPLRPGHADLATAQGPADHREVDERVEELRREVEVP